MRHWKRFGIVGLLLGACSLWAAVDQQDPAGPLWGQAAALQAAGEYQQAAAVYATILAQVPDSQRAAVQIGVCHYHQKDFEAALAAYERALDIDPKCAQGFRGLGVVHMTLWIMDKGEAATELRDKALEAWHRSLELDSNQPDLLRLVKKYRPKVTGPTL